MASSKYNPISLIQKWMDSMAGQTFMQYAYSWGAAVVILGTLFKLTHLEGANMMLFIGMGTEVFVFFIAGFERVTEKVEEKQQAQSAAPVYGTASEEEDEDDVDTEEESYGEEQVEDDETMEENAASTGGGQTIIVGGGVPQGGVVYAGGPIVTGGVVGAPVMGGGVPAEGAAVGSEAAASDAGLSAAAAANLAAAGQAAAEAQLALSQLQGINAAAIQATDPTAIEDAVKGYAEELTQLTEVLGRVKIQAERMSTDSEEMENLNRTLTGIATVYELQLRNISKQVSTIEQIDEQTKRMARQIEELNNVYARMIQALTVNMGAAPAAPATEA